MGLALSAKEARHLRSFCAKGDHNCMAWHPGGDLVQLLSGDLVSYVHHPVKRRLRAVASSSGEGDIVLLLVIRCDVGGEAGTLQHGDKIGKSDEIARVCGAVAGALGAAH